MPKVFDIALSVVAEHLVESSNPEANITNLENAFW